MNNIKNKIVNYMTNGQGFIVESFDINEVYSEYILIKTLPEGIYAILIIDGFLEEEITRKGIKYLSDKGIPFNLNKIVITNSNFVNNIDNVNKIIINGDTKEIIYYSKESINLANNIGHLISKPKNNRTINNGIPIITYSLIGINILFYLISSLMSGSMRDIDINTLYILGAKYGPSIIYNNQWWRLITAMFLHGGMLHIICNMYTLYIIGPQVERFYGKIKFSIIYFGSGIASSLLSLIFRPNSISVGASGAIFGLFGALLIYLIKNKEKFTKASINNILIVIIINLLVGFSVSNIDNYGHIGGLLFGVLSSVLIMTTTKK